MRRSGEPKRRVLRTVKQGVFRSVDKDGGSKFHGNIEILRVVQGRKRGEPEFHMRVDRLILHNPHNAELYFYMSKRRRPVFGWKKLRKIEMRDDCVYLDRGSGGRVKGVGIDGVITQPLPGIPLAHQINAIFIAKPKRMRPITIDTQVFLYAELVNKADRDPSIWYPVLHEQRRMLEDIFFERQRRFEEDFQNMEDNVNLDDAEKSLNWLTANAQKAFTQFDEDGSGAVDEGEFNKMLRHLKFFLLPCNATALFKHCDMEGNNELDRDQFEVAIYCIKVLEEARRHENAERGGRRKADLTLQPYEAFNSFDTDQDGLIDQLEFNEGLRSLGVITSTPSDALAQESRLRNLMNRVIKDSTTAVSKKSLMNDPTRLATYPMFVSAWLVLCNVSEEVRYRGINVAAGETMKQALRKYVLSAATRHEKLMADARARAWKMKRDVRIAKERKKQALEKRAAKEGLEIRKERALQEKADRLAAKAARMQTQKADKEVQKLKVLVAEAEETRRREAREEQRLIIEEKIRDVDRIVKGRGWNYIDYSNQKLVEIPEEIYWHRHRQPGEEHKDLSHVVVVNFSHNRLENLPGIDFWFRLESMRKLDLSNNSLTSLSEGIGDCLQLQIVHANDNMLVGNSVLGKSSPLNKLQKLAVLDLSKNAIEAWSADALVDHTNLESLSLACNCLTSIPGQTAATLHSLKILDLAKNKIHRMGGENGIGLMTNLHTLNLSDNRLESLPEDFGEIGSSFPQNGPPNPPQNRLLYAFSSP